LGYLSVQGAAPEEQAVGGFAAWLSWTTVDPDVVVKPAKGTGKAK
jgi:hypothetical protein